jgi:hypothetical protein
VKENEKENELSAVRPWGQKDITLSAPNIFQAERLPYWYQKRGSVQRANRRNQTMCILIWVAVLTWRKVLGVPEVMLVGAHVRGSKHDRARMQGLEVIGRCWDR